MLPMYSKILGTADLIILYTTTQFQESEFGAVVRPASDSSLLELLLPLLVSDSASESVSVSVSPDRWRFFAFKNASKRSLVFAGKDEMASARFSSVSCSNRPHSFAAKLSGSWGSADLGLSGLSAFSAFSVGPGFGFGDCSTGLALG